MAALAKTKEGVKRRTIAFFEHDAAGGIVLMTAAALALMLDNSPLNWLYDMFLETPVVIQIGVLVIDKPLLLWINDGLMAIFFFLVGLEIKREIIEGRLSSPQKASLPVIAALGGIIVPALIYVALNQGDAEALRGWAIPAATDIAFALGVLALLGSRVPVALKVFLLALAIIDDLGAIIIIALFYTSELSLSVLAIAAVGISVLAYLNYRGVMRVAPYLVTGVIIWVLVLKSGVHATLAGVVIALFIPIRGKDEGDAKSPLKEIEHGLAPWVAFGVMPIFAFANAGVALYSLSIESLFEGIPLGIALGLFVGKQIGIMSFVWVAVKTGVSRLPDDVNWVQMYGVSILAGIGFTMSLFIGTLAFASQEHAAAVRIGVLAGSTISAIVGYFILRATLGRARGENVSGNDGNEETADSAKA
ncbi:MAG: Na+/H+ antiporter NhaA [Rhodospirillales bacterium]|nr:Na+/H+ antiporter NhaA [Rhodospirillales bacterium]MCW8861431.1 Na+/H+ antiporter NhaA [Rhodospirillales bacterium]MCW8951524.1 Na+/H+ antiporter NhaA [Rhodospirillales bacterium]MCW8971591.1 Na+/H+ antiporter NhaA [Rhodospirillales bacterium]MCW9003044.1 Na+/H+ antiporter NhaA [Rhodospirillales bacterium]